MIAECDKPSYFGPARGSGVMLVVEDNDGDVRLIKEALQARSGEQNMHVVRDGVEATSFLRRETPYEEAPQPDLILLDLQLPKKDGCELLSDVRSDPDLKHIPVVIFSSSAAESDVSTCYELGANCYVVKPFDPDRFMQVVEDIKTFWFTIVSLPGRQ